MKLFGVEVNLVSVNFDFKSMTEAMEKVLFDWPLRLTSKTSVQIDPKIRRHNIEGVGVCYTVSHHLDDIPSVFIVDLICRSRKVQYLFRECNGTLRETREYPRFTTRLVCQACGAEYPTMNRDKLAEQITAYLRRKGSL